MNHSRPPFVTTHGKECPIDFQRGINLGLWVAVAFLLTGFLARAELPYPPNVIRDGNLIPGVGGGVYTTGAVWTGSSYQTKTLTISGTSVLYGEITTTPVPPVLVSSGYWGGGYWTAEYWIPGYWTGGFWEGGYYTYYDYVPGYWEDGYWEGGFWEGGYYDADGNRVPETWNQGTWHDAVWHPEENVGRDWVAQWNPGTWILDEWVSGTWVEYYWVPEVWKSQYDATTQYTEFGTYQHFAIQMDSGVPITPASASGRPWSATPQLGFPVFEVAGNFWGFNAADEEIGYDYFTSPNGDGYLWVTSSFYGGYDPEPGSFGGTNANGYCHDYTGSSVRIAPRNGDGSFLSVGSPLSGPALIWSNGFTFQFLTSDLVNGADIYLNDTLDPIIIQFSDVAGLATGTYSSLVFQASPAATFAAAGDGSPLPVTSAPHWGPPAVKIGDGIWRYRGSITQADYYGGDRPGQILSVAASGTVSFSDQSLGFEGASGSYHAGSFAGLPVTVEAVTAEGQPWAPAPPDPNMPPMVVIDGQPWHYSAALSTSGVYTYTGPQDGQMVTISGSRATFWDPATNTYLVGSYGNGVFTFTGKSVRAANLNGTPFTATSAADGTLDITGNALTLGTWMRNGASLNGLTISFTPGSGDQASWLQFDAIKPATDWIWRNAGESGTLTERLRMTADGKVGVGTSSPAAKLHVAGDAKFEGVVHVAPGGDVPMFQP